MKNNRDFFYKPYKNNEKQNYEYISQLNLQSVVPPYDLQKEFLVLLRCESIYPYFELTNEYLKLIYETTLQQFYKINVNSYSQGFYKYITLTEDVIRAPQLTEDKLFYFQYVKQLLVDIEDKLQPDYQGYKEIIDLRLYILNKIEYYSKWSPPLGFKLLHGDFKISNMVYMKGPLLIDLEYLRYGPPEIELSNFLVQLVGMKKSSDVLMVPYFKEIFKAHNVFGKIDYDMVRELGIPILFLFRTIYALAGKIGSVDRILDSYPLMWRKYKEELL